MDWLSIPKTRRNAEQSIKPMILESMRRGWQRESHGAQDRWIWGVTAYLSRNPWAGTRATRKRWTVSDRVLEAPCGRAWGIRTPGHPVLGALTVLAGALPASHSKHCRKIPSYFWLGKRKGTILKDARALLNKTSPQVKLLIQSLTSCKQYQSLTNLSKGKWPTPGYSSVCEVHSQRPRLTGRLRPSHMTIARFPPPQPCHQRYLQQFLLPSILCLTIKKKIIGHTKRQNTHNLKIKGASIRTRLGRDVGIIRLGI